MKNLRRNIAGYTLIGMAIAVGVAGLLVAGATSGLSIYYHEKRIDDTISNTQTVVDAISNYLTQYGHYPCPAPLDAESGTAGYGMPSDCELTAGVISVADKGTFVAAEGLWVEESHNTALADRVVVRGAVPFRVLNIPEFKIKDAYGNRLEYVVTRTLTESSTYSNSNGGITLEDAEGNSILPIPDTLRFLVYSPGRDKVGGYSYEGGQLMVPCDTSLGFFTMAMENCNTAPDDGGTASIIEDAAEYLSSYFADIGPDLYYHYDDHVGFSYTPGLPVWITADNDPSHIWFDTDTSGSAAIGYPTYGEVENVDATLKVKGTMNVSKDIQADYLCDTTESGRDSAQDNTYCVQVEDIFSAAVTSCAPNFVQSISSYGVSGLQVTCTAGVTEVRCPPGKVVSGITATGLECSDPPPPLSAYGADTSCPAYSVPGCVDTGSGVANMIALAAAAQGTTSVATDGTYQATYRCDNRNWVYESSTGECDSPSICSATISGLQYTAFAFVHPTDGGPQTGWSGVWEATEGDVCLEDVSAVASAAVPDDIQCEAGAIEEFMEDCSSGNEGFLQKAHEWTCGPAGWISEVTTAGACAATPAAGSPTLECPEGLSGAAACSTCTSFANEAAETPLDTSTTSITPDEVQSVTIETAVSGNTYNIGEPIFVYSASNLDHSLYGFVGNYDGAQELTIQVTRASGGSAQNDWRIFHNPLPLTIRTRKVNDQVITEERSFNCASVPPFSPWTQILLPAPHAFPLTGAWDVPANAVLGESKLGPFKDKGSNIRAGDACSEINVRRACYAPADSDSLDGREQYYHYKDCVCQ